MRQRSKQEIKVEVLETLNSLSGQARMLAERDLFDQVLAWLADKGWEKIACYYGFWPEITSIGLIDELLATGYRVYLPRMEAGYSMHFHEYRRGDKLDLCYGKIYQPLDTAPSISASQLDLMIVPGLAFTQNGDRLGFGAGYYDRFLALHPQKTLSLAFACQIYPDGSWPVEPHDVAIDQLIITGVEE